MQEASVGVKCHQVRPWGPGLPPPAAEQARGHQTPKSTPDTATRLTAAQGSPTRPLYPDLPACPGQPVMVMRSSLAWVSCPCPPGPALTPACWCLWKSYGFFGAQQT